MHSRRLISTIIIGLLAWTTAGAEEGGPRVVSKPKAPLSVSIEPVQGSGTAAETTPEQVVELRIIVRSLIDLPDVSASVSAIGGAEITAGEASWSGPLPRNTMKAWNISVRTSGTGGGKISVRAEEGRGTKISFRAESVYELGKSAGRKSPAGKKVKDRQGRDVIEYEVK
jgi:hypothetical protein